MKYYILTAIGSAAIAAGVTYLATKNHYEKVLQEEIDSVKEHYAKKKPEKEPKSKQQELSEEAQNKEDLMTYAKKLAEERYTSSVEEFSRKPFEKEEPNFDVEYIDPNEYGLEEDDWDEISLSYYLDDVLADELDEVIEGDERFEIVGNFEKHFGDYEDDSVFVKNNKRKAYYEILLVNQKYGEKAKPAIIEVNEVN